MGTYALLVIFTWVALLIAIGILAWTDRWSERRLRWAEPVLGAFGVPVVVATWAYWSYTRTDVASDWGYGSTAADARGAAIAFFVSVVVLLATELAVLASRHTTKQGA